MIWWLAATALAAPDRVAALFPTSSAVNSVAVSPDAAFVAFTTSGGEVVLFDTASWYYWNVETASAAGAGVALGSGYLAVALADGTAEVYTLDRYYGPSLSYTLDSGGEIEGLAADRSYLYAAYSVEDDNPYVQGFSFETGESTGEAVQLGQSAFVEMGARWASAGTDGDGAYLGGEATVLYVVVGSDDVSRVTLSDGVVGAASLTQQNEGSHDIGNLWLPIGGYAWFADEGGSNNSVAYQASDTAELNLTFPAQPDLGDCLAVGGVDGDTEAWFAASGDDAIHIYSFDGTSVGSETASVTESAGASQLESIAGYLFAGVGEGLHILTDRPWVDISSVDPYEALPGDNVTVTFSSDMDGDYTIELQNVDGGTVETVGSGSVVADESVAVEVTIPEVEGSESGDVQYLLTISVNPGDSSRVGRDADYVERNAAPEQVTIESDSILAGDRRIVIEFDAFDEGDASAYDIYFSTVEFTADEYASGGPPFVGPDGTLELPRTATPDVLGIVKLSLDPVTNGTTYYVGIRAIDETVEGPMSTVKAVTPNETYAVSEQLGIESWCGLPLASAGWLGVMAAGWLVVRRRSAGALVALVGLALVPAAAQAKPHEDDLTARNWDLEFRYGPFLSQAEGPLTDAFGSTDNRLLRGDFGWCSNFAEVDFGFGLWQDGGSLVFGDGTESGDDNQLLAFPLSIDGTLRLDFWKEQPVVPYGRVGADLWLWNESWQAEYDAGGGDSVTAGTWGWHWGAGLAVLLDGIDLSASSRLETVAGVNDTYLVAEYRQSYALGDASEILDFTSSDVTVGLKFDY